ncbi:MAG: protein translocase subunit SecD [Patescibacteria group bacterium]
MSLRRRFWLIIILFLVTIYLNYPGAKLKTKDLALKKGLDLQGGTHLVLEADMNQIEAKDRLDALDSAKEILSRRVDLYGVSEPLIQTSILTDSYRIIVELPGIKDVSQAVALIGQTAQLDFREDPTATPSSTSFVFQPTGLTGQDLKKASVSFGQSNSGEPVVDLEFTNEGATKFADLTQRNVNFPIAIFLDESLVTAPVVNEPILNGRAQISGNFTPEAASDLVIQLNAGALPVPIKIIEQTNISATLGSDSVSKSLTAGLLGLGLVMLFMVLYYGLNGLIADLALVLYGLITLSLYRLIPVTLTLPGIAGFILSVGMAVDANILIFERLKEELRAGRNFHLAMELGFGRAWDSIKDANTTTIVASLILLNPLNWQFLNTSGLVKGFALTLLIGVAISLFTGIFVTRTLMRVIYKSKN